MKHIIFLAIFLSIAFYDSFSQFQKPEKSEIACNKEFVLTIAQEMPKLQISIESLEDYLNQNIKPSKDQVNQVGKMDIGFVINCKGEAGEYHLGRTNMEGLFDPIVKLLKEKCEWKPGVQKNYDIDMYYSFNVTLSDGRLKINTQNYRY